jgi:SulP family sulfate permease
MRFFVRRRLWHAVVVMVVTIGATYVLNLTQAILIGVGLSVMWFVRQASVIDVSREQVDPARMEARGHVLRGHHPGVEVVYVTGPLYFGTVVSFLEAIDLVPPTTDLILSLRGMPTVDASGVQAIDDVIQRQHRGGGSVHLTGLQPSARRRLERSGVLEHLGSDHIHWGADQAIAKIDATRHPEPIDA